MGVMKEIREHLAQGESAQEVIALGYRPGTVYQVQRQRRDTNSKAKSSATRADADTKRNNEKAQPPIEERSVPGIDNDPDILELRKELRRARLERQLEDLKKESVPARHGVGTIEVDGEVIRLYHLVLARARELDVNYNPTLQRWLRESVFRFYWEHPETVDVKVHFTPDAHGIVEQPV